MRSYLSVGVSNGLGRVEDKGQAEIGNAGGQIGFEQDVLGLEVTVGHGRFAQITFGGRELFVEVSQPASHALGDADQFRPRNRITLRDELNHLMMIIQHRNLSEATYFEIVAEGSFLVEGGYEPKLGLEAVASLFSTHELKNVVMVQLR